MYYKIQFASIKGFCYAKLIIFHLSQSYFHRTVHWVFHCLPECVPIVHVDFNGDHIINLSHESYLQINNVQQVESGIPDVTYGLFNGQSSSIQIPRLNAVALPRLKIQLRFYASMPSNSRYQVLVSNCRSSAKPWNILDVAQDQSPSLAIIANTLDQHLTFLGYSDDWKVTPVTFHLPYKVSILYVVTYVTDVKKINEWDQK